jgi:hypothetical protein
MKITEQVLVTKGNFPLFPGGQPVWGDPIGKKTPILRVAAGQAVVYDGATGISLGAGDSIDDYPNIVVAVGVSGSGQGLAEQLVTASGQTINGCSVTSLSVKPPVCGRPEIQDLLFTCTEANEPYSVKIAVWDADVRSQYAYNRKSEYVFTRQVIGAGCVDCSPADVSKQLACELVDAINGKQPAGWNTYKNGKFIERPDLPFSAARLMENSYLFCLSGVTPEGCDKCDAVERLHSLTFGETTYEFVNAEVPGAVSDDRTLIGQLEGIVEQITTALAGNGSATLISSGAPCCPYSIEVNTCVEDFVLLGWDPEEGEAGGTYELTPCETTNPLTIDAHASTCLDCEDAATGEVTFPAGIRIVGAPVEPGTGCYIPQPVKTYLGRQVDIYPIGGFRDGTFQSVTIQTARNSSNLGSQLIHTEYRQNVGGPGRHLNRPYNSRSGRFGLPLAGDRIAELHTDPQAQYCHYVMEHGMANLTQSYWGDKYAAKVRTRVLIPSSDNVTIGDLEGFFNQYFNDGNCVNLPTLDCLD